MELGRSRRTNPRNCSANRLRRQSSSRLFVKRIEDHGLTVEEVEAVLAAPEQRVAGHSGRMVLQSKVGRFLIRVIIEQDRDPPEVVTAYRTRHVQKSWQVNDED
jgi:hypothetical protein